MSLSSPLRLARRPLQPHILLKPYHHSLRPLTTTSRSHQAPAHPSVSTTELSHFSALASSWWDPLGPSRLLHLMNPLRHDFIRSCLASSPQARDPSTKLSYLDVGCGGGIFAESAARLHDTESVTAIDPSEEVLTVARAHGRRDPMLAFSGDGGKEGKLRYIRSTIEELTQNTGDGHSYDVLTLFEVLEHVPSPSAFLAQCARHVKPGGWLVLSTIARTWTSWFTTKFVAEDVVRMVPRGTHDWEKYLNEEEVRAWFGGELAGTEEQKGRWDSPRAMGVVYVPGVGWRELSGGEKWGNYFFGVRKKPVKRE